MGVSSTYSSEHTQDSLEVFFYTCFLTAGVIFLLRTLFIFASVDLISFAVCCPSNQRDFKWCCEEVNE